MASMSESQRSAVLSSSSNKTKPWSKRSQNTSEGAGSQPQPEGLTSSDASIVEKGDMPTERWSMGILNDKQTEEVPGTVLLLSSNRNEPLGLQHQPERISSSSMPSQHFETRRPTIAEKKKTADGQILLDPQPDDSLNDPLNWPAWRRDAALFSLGFYCMLGGGMTPILAAGFNDVARTFDVTYARVALTTGLYMMGLAVGSVIFSPTAILFGKRPVYLLSAIMFILTSIWCAKAPDFANLATARVFQGISVSPVECLPSATIAEIFFLHERAFRVGIYTLLLLGGKNLVPLVSAAIIQSMEWRWVFYVVAIIVGFGLCLLFLFVPETFWDRTPRAKSRKPSIRRSFSSLVHHPIQHLKTHHSHTDADLSPQIEKLMSPRQQRLHEQDAHARFQDTPSDGVAEMIPDVSGARISPVPAIQIQSEDTTNIESQVPANSDMKQSTTNQSDSVNEKDNEDDSLRKSTPSGSFAAPPQAAKPTSDMVQPQNPKSPRLKIRPTLSGSFVFASNLSSDKQVSDNKLTTDRQHSAAIPAFLTQSVTTPVPDKDDSAVPHLHNLNSPYYVDLEKSDDYFGHHKILADVPPAPEVVNDEAEEKLKESSQSFPDPEMTDNELEHSTSIEKVSSPKLARYTTNLRHAPPKSYMQTLRPWNGRLRKSNWFLVALRPFILFAYPSVLWSTLVYSLSVGWLIVLSESVSDIYRNKNSYRFSALGTGLVYLSPFIGGILGTAVAGKVSDIIVRYMSRRNGGVYEPEFRLVMAVPVAISTAIGLMGYGWSAEERDRWIVPTIFFGVISFGCSLGSTTAITFCVDSYRQYAGEALVTLNFSKNIFHGLVFSLFFPNWLQTDGPKKTFLAIGGIQVACLLTTIPMYIYGKRARMWTVRKKLMERF